MERGRQKRKHMKINKCKENTKEMEVVRAKAGTGELQLQAKPGPLSDFVNKVLLALSHSHHFTWCLWLPSHYRGRAE